MECDGQSIAHGTAALGSRLGSTEQIHESKERERERERENLTKLQKNIFGEIIQMFNTNSVLMW